MFTVIDWIVLAAYLLFSLFIGLWVSRGNKNLKEYMFGGGAMPWVAVGISLIATSVSATTFLGAPADVFGDDMTFLMFQIGALISIIVVGLVFIPRFRTAGINSAYELFEVRFGSKTVRRLAAVFYCLHLLLRTGILLYGPSLVLAQILHVDMKVAIIVSAAVAIFYTWFGGIKAVIWTDVLQFCVFFGGGVVVLILISNAVGGFGEMATLASEAGKTRWWNPSFDISDARTLVSAGFAYAILEIAIRGCDQQFVQRYLSCKDVKAANRSSILSMVLGCAVSILFYWVGAALYVYYKAAHTATLPEGIGQNDVFPYFIVNALPQGLTGLIVAAICAAAMSSLSGAINSLSNTSEHDFLGWEESKGMGGLKRALCRHAAGEPPQERPLLYGPLYGSLAWHVPARLLREGPQELAGDCGCPLRHGKPRTRAGNSCIWRACSAWRYLQLAVDAVHQHDDNGAYSRRAQVCDAPVREEVKSIF